MKARARSLALLIPPLCILALLVAPRPACPAIVNTLTGFAADEPGWSGGVEAGYSASGGNSEVTHLTAGARAQRLGERHRWRLLGGYERETSGGEEVGRSLLGHLRHNRRLGRVASTLAFAQVQNNPFQRLRSRLLLGGGLRFDLAAGADWRLAIGAAHMVEIEDLEDVDDEETDHRLSSFLALGRRLREGVRLEATAFFQPRWSDPGDHRILVNAGLGVDLGGGLAHFTRFALEHDSEPPPGVEKTDWKLAVGLELKL
jgi:putative salt-induced outer membrane protein YdiY